MRAAAVGLLAVLAGAPSGIAQTVVPRSTATAAPAPAPPSRLNLGPYRSVAADDPRAIADELRFREQVEVRGKAMDARSLTAKLEWWMKDIDLSRGATPAALSAPSIAEMRDYRPHVSDSIGHRPAEPVDFMPAIRWLTDKLGGKKKED